MEYNSSSEDLKGDSPSQDDIGYTHPMKLDLESMDDFEHITKEVSPSKEATAQFLQHETTYATNQNRDTFEAGDATKYGETMEDESHGLKSSNTNPWADETASLMDIPYKSSDVLIPTPSSELMEHTFEDDDVGSSKNFMQYERMHEDNKGHGLPTKEVTSNEDKLIDFEPPTVFDESPVKPGDFMLTNNSEILIPDTSESKNTPPTVISHSLPGIITNENDFIDDLAEKLLQGDGPHLKQLAGMDASDIEEHVPEPVPKDYPEIGVMEPKDFLSAIGIDNWFRPERLNPKVESLIYWRDVKKSGIAFGSGLIVLLSLCYYSLISVVAYTSLIVLGASASLKIYQYVVKTIQKSDATPFKEKLEKILMHPVVIEVFHILEDLLDFSIEVNEDKLREFLDALVKNLNSFVMEIRRRFLIEDVVDSVKFGLILWAMTYIGSWFNGLTLLIINYVALFTLPKVYENNKVQIDANLEIVKEKINLISDKIRAVIPLGKKEEAKSKNE